MDQLNKNYIKYVSEVKTYWKSSTNKNIYVSKIYNIKNKKISKYKWISTCLIRGRLKKTYKNNNVSRHFLRDESNKKLLNIWEVKTW